MPISLQNKSGFTLVEVIVATLITLVVLVGIMQALDVASEHNLRNQVREEAANIAEAQMSRFRSIRFEQVSSSGSPYIYPALSIKSRLRGFNRSYTVYRTVTPITVNGVPAGSKSIDVKVRWSFKNISTTHEMMSVRSQ